MPDHDDALQTLDLGAIPEGNLPQLWFAFMVDSELQWIDFISRDGGMSHDPEKFGAILPRRYMQITIRLHRSECHAEIEKMREATERFLADVDATIERLNGICPELPPEPERTAEDFGALGITDADLAFLAEQDTIAISTKSERTSCTKQNNPNDLPA